MTQVTILEERGSDKKLTGDFLPEQGIWGNDLTSVLMALCADQHRSHRSQE